MFCVGPCREFNFQLRRNFGKCKNCFNAASTNCSINRPESVVGTGSLKVQLIAFQNSSPHALADHGVRIAEKGAMAVLFGKSTNPSAE